MQTITPVGIHIENEWSYGSNSRSHVKKDRTTVNRGGRQAARMRTCVASKLKSSKTKNSHIPQQVVQTKQVLPVHSRSPSPNREPWYEKIIFASFYFLFLKDSSAGSINQRTKICLAGEVILGL